MTDSDGQKELNSDAYSPAPVGGEPADVRRASNGGERRASSGGVRRASNAVVKASDSSIIQTIPDDAFDVKPNSGRPKSSSYSLPRVEYPAAPFVVQGNLTWNEDALTAIAQHAIDRTDGIGVVSKQPTGVLSRFFTRTKSDIPQLQLKLMTSRSVTFDVDVWVRYGNPITDVCDKLTASVNADLERLAGLSGIVNIRVRGVV